MTRQSPTAELEAPRIVQMPAIRVAGLTRRYPATGEAMRMLSGQWQDFAHGPGGRLLAGGPVMYGIHAGLFGDGGEDDYTSGVEIGPRDAVPAGLAELRLPPITCAVIDHAGHASEISLTTSAYLRDWLPSSGYRLAPARPFDLIERYGKGFDPASGRGDMQLIIPVEA